MLLGKTLELSEKIGRLAARIGIFTMMYYYFLLSILRDALCRLDRVF
jgi:hypothetical protein